MKQGIGCHCQTHAGWPFPQHGTSPEQLGGRGSSFPSWEWSHLAGVHTHPFPWSLQTQRRPASSRNGSQCRLAVSITCAPPPAADVVGVEWGLCTFVVQWSTARFGPTPVNTQDVIDERRCTRKGISNSWTTLHPDHLFCSFLRTDFQGLFRQVPVMERLMVGKGVWRKKVKKNEGVATAPSPFYCLSNSSVQ